MNKQTEALKMAIEYLEFEQSIWRGEGATRGAAYYDTPIKACKEALEQPEQEPVAWLSTDSKANEIIKTHPAPSWQGLSDTEIAFMAVPFYDADNLIANEFGFARAIEQALKEKNT